MVKLKACVLAAKQCQALGFAVSSKLATPCELFTALCDELGSIEEVAVAVVMDELTASDKVIEDLSEEYMMQLQLRDEPPQPFHQLLG